MCQFNSIIFSRICGELYCFLLALFCPFLDGGSCTDDGGGLDLPDRSKNRSEEPCAERSAIRLRSPFRPAHVPHPQRRWRRGRGPPRGFPPPRPIGTPLGGFRDLACPRRLLLWLEETLRMDWTCELEKVRFACLLLFYALFREYFSPLLMRSGRCSSSSSSSTSTSASTSSGSSGRFCACSDSAIQRERKRCAEIVVRKAIQNLPPPPDPFPTPIVNTFV